MIHRRVCPCDPRRTRAADATLECNTLSIACHETSTSILVLVKYPKFYFPEISETQILEFLTFISEIR